MHPGRVAQSAQPLTQEGNRDEAMLCDGLRGGNGIHDNGVQDIIDTIRQTQAAGTPCVLPDRPWITVSIRSRGTTPGLQETAATPLSL